VWPFVARGGTQPSYGIGVDFAVHPAHPARMFWHLLLVLLSPLASRLSALCSAWPRICWRWTMDPPPLRDAEAYCLRNTWGVTAIPVIPAALAHAPTIGPTRLRHSLLVRLRLGNRDPSSGRRSPRS
jgi:hypothetical protein